MRSGSFIQTLYFHVFAAVKSEGSESLLTKRIKVEEEKTANETKNYVLIRMTWGIIFAYLKPAYMRKHTHKIA